MVDDPAIGDRVTFKAGRGHSKGEVLEYLEDDKVRIKTDTGLEVCRHLHSITEIERAAPKAKKGGGRKKKSDSEE